MGKITKNKVINFLHKIPILQYSLILIAISVLLFIPTDPDFFWHLKYGELTLEQGPLSYNPLSYTFSDFVFFDYEWLSNLITYILYKLGNFPVVSIFYGCIVIIAFVISINIKMVRGIFKQNQIVMLLVGLITSMPIIGVRPQMFSLLGLALTYYLLINFLKTGSKKILILPLIMILWVNLHPGFLAGIILILLITAVEIIKALLRKFEVIDRTDPLYKKTPNLRTLILVTLLSSVATLFTPYFHSNLFQSITFGYDPYALENIVEWFAPNFHRISGKIALFYILLTAFALLRRKAINLTEILVLTLFGFMALNCIRHLTLFVIVSLPSILACRTRLRIPKFESHDPLFLTAKSVFFLSSIIIFLFNLFDFLITNTDIVKIYQRAEYPYEAVNFLKTQNYEGNVFNSYEWGGFLTWDYPEKKTFIDGRMTSWQMDGKRILEEYNEIANLKTSDWKTKLESYDITIVLVDNRLPIGNALREDAQWELVYEDETSIVFHDKV
jgi:hypothetical protein